MKGRRHTPEQIVRKLREADRRGERYVLFHVGPDDGVPGGSYERAHHRVAPEDEDLLVRERLQQLALEHHRRYGYRPLTALLRREGALVAAPLAAGSAAIWLLAPPLAHWLLAGRYDLDEALIAVMLVSGWLKILNGFLTALIVSCGEERRLGLLSAICWGSLGVSIAGAFVATPWGLVGVLYGITMGWLVRCVLAGWLAVACLKEPRPYLRITPQPKA